MKSAKLSSGKDNQLQETQKQLALTFDNGESLFVKIGSNRFYGADYIDSDLHIYRYEHNIDSRSGKRKQLITKQGLKWLAQQAQQKDGGVLLGGSGINSFTHYKEHQLKTRDLIFECDQISIEQQWEQIKWFENLTGLTLLVMHTGGKSLHAHLYSDRQLPMELAMFYRQCLCIIMQSDWQLTKPSQPYRLAGFHRKDKNNDQKLLQTSQRYREAQIKQALKTAFETKGLIWHDQYSIAHWGLIRKAIETQDDLQVQNAVNHGLEKIAAENQLRENLRQQSTFEQTTSTDEILKALWSINPECGYDNWLHIGMALHSHDSNLFSEWDNWSSGAKKYRGSHTLQKMWQNFNRQGSITIGTLFHIAKDHGYPAPAKEYIKNNNPQPCKQREIEEEKFLNWQSFEEHGRKFLNYLNKGMGLGKKINLLPKNNPNSRDLKTQEIIPIEQWRESHNEPQVIKFDSQTPRAEIILATQKAGYTQGQGLVLDTSTMGTGKTHSEAEFAMNQRIQFQVEGKSYFSRSIYVSQKHNNPTVELFKKALNLEARNEENCMSPEKFNTAYDQGYSMAGENPICAKCPNLKQCKTQEGWYKFERSKVLSAGKKETIDQGNGIPQVVIQKATLRGTLAQIPRGDFEHTDTDLVIDENDSWNGKIILAASLADLDTTLADLGQFNPELEKEVKPLFTNLRNLFQITKKHGLTNSKTLEFIEKGINLTKEQLLALDKFALFEYEPYNKEKIAHGKEVPKNFLFLLTEALLQGTVTIRFDSKHLLFVKRDDRFDELFPAVHQIRVLDATANIHQIASMYNVDINQILEIRAKTPPITNLKIRLIKTSGIRTNEWSESAIARIKSTIEQLYQKGKRNSLITHKKQKEHLANIPNLKFDQIGHFFHDNRGSNEFIGHEVLFAVGTPNTNLGAIADECLVFGLDKETYYAHTIAQEIIQTLGRQRAIRNPNKQFEYNHLLTASDAELEQLCQTLTDHGFTDIEIINAGALTPLAGTNQQQKMFDAITEGLKLCAKGVKITQEKVAEQMGIYGETLRRAIKCPWHLVLKLIQLCWLKKSPHSPINNKESLWGLIQSTLKTDTDFGEIAQILEYLNNAENETTEESLTVLEALIPHTEKLLAILLVIFGEFCQTIDLRGENHQICENS